ncbi:unnamed protein product [Didymodactylos carnosus]|uniref:TIR domain-containing protein n=1 Tax=Didymodactylos carnosus TaxID=1234261 RepID=A0A814KNS0_9BILA|nr:unnamed protein product [Didymodactylos carnosus]CAF1052108.1 unnamed protein product [Didymodactylos carnosus]CAF3768102.1 unnamed protein product [Didymodactylos carnosus]CAF3821540.1 unnamed protein product [Didymodactylos carnosus]
MRAHLEQSKTLVQALMDYSLQDSEFKSLVSLEIIRFFKITTRKTTLIPLLLDCGIAEACVKWISVPNPSYNSLQLILRVIHNISRHNGGSDRLNELKMTTVMHRLKRPREETNFNDNDYEEVQLAVTMIYALLLEPQTLKNNTLLSNERFIRIIKQILQMIITASQHTNGFYFYNCFHISEPLIVLTKLFNNDSVLLHCLGESPTCLDFFCQLLIQIHCRQPSAADEHEYITVLNYLAVIALCNILWSISFHDQYKEKLKEKTEILKLIDRLSSGDFAIQQLDAASEPRHLSSIRKACEGILWNLEEKVVTPITPTLMRQRPMAMISYSHVDTPFCKELVAKLQTHNEFDLWVDFLHYHQDSSRSSISHSDDIWEEIARAIELASIIILIVSKDYYDSKSCRQELSYASDALKKRIIPIYTNTVQQNYKANGWLGIRIAGQKYIHFGRKSLDLGVRELVSMISDPQKPQPVLPSPSVLEQKQQLQETNEKNPVGQWTKEDLHQWFITNQIHSNLELLYNELHTGTSLVLYARHLKMYYRQEYEFLCDKHREKYYGKQLDTVQFIVFVDALLQLDKTDLFSKEVEEQMMSVRDRVKEQTENEQQTWL